jgi:hypothetical protein
LNERVKKNNEREDEYFQLQNQKQQKLILSDQLVKNHSKNKISQSMRNSLEGDDISETDKDYSNSSQRSVNSWDESRDSNSKKSMTSHLFDEPKYTQKKVNQNDFGFKDKEDNSTKGEQPTKFLTLADLKSLNMDVDEANRKFNGYKEDTNDIRFMNKIKTTQKTTDENDAFAIELANNELAQHDNSNIASDEATVGSEMDHDQDLLDFDLDPEFTSDNDIQISFKVKEVIENNHETDEEDNFRYYYQSQYIFQIGICQIYITEVEAFQNNIDMNMFICQYLASLFAKTEFIDYVDYAKASLGKRLIEVLNANDKKYTELLDQYILNMKSDSQKKLMQNLEDTLPTFLDNLLTLIEKIAAEYIKKIQKDFDTIIEPLLDQLTRNSDSLMKQENITISREAALKLLMSTYTAFENKKSKTTNKENKDEDNPTLYKIRILEILRLNKANLGEDLHSEFYSSLPDMILLDKESLCHSHEVFGSNTYYGDCGYLLMEAGIKDRVVSKCRQFFISIFSLAQSLPGYCERLGNVKKFTEEIFSKSIIELAKNLLLFNSINIENISRVLYDYMKQRLEEVNNIIEMYQQTTTKKMKFTNEVKVQLFPLFNFTRLIFKTNSNLDSKIRIIDNYVNNYLVKIKQYRYGYTKEVMSMMRDISNQLTINEKSSLIKNKLNNIRFRKNMKFFCVVSNDLRLSNICDSIFEKVNFPFLYLYYNYDFVFEYINSFIQQYVKDFDLMNNDAKKITAFFKIQIHETISLIRIELIKSLYLFSPEIIETLSKEKLMLILIFAKTIQRDASHLSLEDDIMPHLNILIKEYLPKIKDEQVETGLMPFFKNIAKDMLNVIKFKNIMYFDKLIIYYIREMTDFKNMTKVFLMDNLWMIYTHFDNWDYNMNYYIENFKQINTDNLMLDCLEKRKNKKIEVCKRGHTNSPFVVNACPPFSSSIENGICVSDCPEGFQDEGLFCLKPKVIFKKIYQNPEDCDSNIGCVKLADRLYIDRCPKLFSSISVMCFPECPYGTIDSGNSCKKKIVGRMTYYF